MIWACYCVIRCSEADVCLRIHWLLHSLEDHLVGFSFIHLYFMSCRTAFSFFVSFFIFLPVSFLWDGQAL